MRHTPQQMRAAIFNGPGDIRVESVPTPEAGPGDVVIKVKACGICGSDLHSYRRGMYVAPGQIMGHEFIGEIAARGDRTAGFNVGDRVTGFYADFCRTCFWCRKKQYMLCPNLYKHSTGFGYPGAFAEYLKIPDAKEGINVHHIPDEIDDIAGAAIEPVGVAAYAVGRIGPAASDKVVVLGCGMVGNVAMQIIKREIGAQVAVTDVSAKKLTVAESLGADCAINARLEDVVARVKQLYGVGPYHFGEGAMADIVIEAAGVQDTIEQSFELVRSGGLIAMLGLSEQKASVNFSRVVHKAPRIMGLLGGDMKASIRLLQSGHVSVGDLISGQFALADIKDAFEFLANEPDAIKAVIVFN